jgi:hypothetical protein
MRTEELVITPESPQHPVLPYAVDIGGVYIFNTVHIPSFTDGVRKGPVGMAFSDLGPPSHAITSYADKEGYAPTKRLRRERTEHIRGDFKPLYRTIWARAFVWHLHYEVRGLSGDSSKGSVSSHSVTYLHVKLGTPREVAPHADRIHLEGATARSVHG